MLGRLDAHWKQPNMFGGLPECFCLGIEFYPKNKRVYSLFFSSAKVIYQKCGNNIKLKEYLPFMKCYYAFLSYRLCIGWTSNLNISKMCFHQKSNDTWLTHSPLLLWPYSLGSCQSLTGSLHTEVWVHKLSRSVLPWLPPVSPRLSPLDLLCLPWWSSAP